MGGLCFQIFPATKVSYRSDMFTRDTLTLISISRAGRGSVELLRWRIWHAIHRGVTGHL